MGTQSVFLVKPSFFSFNTGLKMYHLTKSIYSHENLNFRKNLDISVFEPFTYRSRSKSFGVSKVTLSPCTSAVIDSHTGFGILTTSQQVIRSLIGPCWTDQASNMNKLYRYPDGSRKYLVYPTFLYPVNVTLIERSSLGSRTPRFGSNVRV